MKKPLNSERWPLFGEMKISSSITGLLSVCMYRITHSQQQAGKKDMILFLSVSLFCLQSTLVGKKQANSFRQKHKETRMKFKLLSLSNRKQ